jgi:hypothetical protein
MSVPNLEGVSPEHHGLYAQQDDGSFKLQIDNTPAPATPPAPVNPPTAKPTVLTVIPDDVKKRLEKLDQLEKAEEERNNQKLKDAGDFETLKANLEQKHADALAEKDRQYNELKAKYEGSTIKSAVQEAISSVGGDLEVLTPHVMPHIKMVDDKVVVVDAEGNTRMTGKAGKSDPMSVAEFVTNDIRENASFQKLFTGTSASGGGTRPAPSSTVGNVTSKSQLKSPKDKVAYIKKHGEDAYKKLPA